ncbi:MAG TPA: anaerobic carbon-monoxide dehydrogenase catalytic subunit [Candidatus Wujingus californicus]|uniref:anaerobic carbon-monoxide dehydrogenase catalytic subunit n=1 Tax=Candidatus Wujingus californicus TaxID=3367618 RepID=UPI001DA5EB1B|nr:anaerobic carbon-monoxide dehydrogenase catalytic subunit [Planctomycetota bacterium]MDO8132290.1 anaerobic carbon-monoxide dehydrogenase catalytic subunit [Candidatus Brocadiales bacterium]
MDEKEKTIDQVMLDRMQEMKVETMYDRYKAQQPQCGYGSLALCCRHCNYGPCNIDPFGPGPKKGVCGADANTFAARHFLRMAGAGTACHSDHGRAVAHLLVSTARGEAPGYRIKDVDKLMMIAECFGIKTKDRKTNEIAEEVGEMALMEFGKPYGALLFLRRAPETRQKVWEKLGIAPRAIDREVCESFHRTGIGGDQDYNNLTKQSMRVALADGWGGSMIATELQDILFGTPKPVQGRTSMGVLKKDHVNVIVHGHEPQLAEAIVLASGDPEVEKAAKAVGAKGVVIAGLCCTANELLVRHGIPMAGHMTMQEGAISTGAVELMVVDIQCVMQALAETVKHFHTKLVTTLSKAKIAGAEHVEFEEENALEAAKKVLMMAIANYKNRDNSKVFIPSGAEPEIIAGFSHETIKYMLGGRFRASYRPLNDNIINGRIRGVVGIAGCTSPRMDPGTLSYVNLVKELIANDFLVVTTGCAAGQCASSGLMLPELKDACGPGLKEVCEAVGMPPVLHSGACVDNSRILIACSEMVKEGGLGNDISDLPVAGTCLEWMSEKAIAIGQYFVASGVYTVFGMNSPVSGSPDMQKLLTKEMEEIVGARWDFEKNLKKIGGMLMDHIEKKREALGINVKKERKLYDMAERRALERECKPVPGHH